MVEIDEGTQRCLVFTLKSLASYLRDKIHFHQQLIEMTGYSLLLFVCSPHNQLKQSGKSYWKNNLFTNMSNCFLFWSSGPASSRAHKIICLESDLKFVTNITNYIRGEEIVMWRNFSFPCMTIVGKLKISPHMEKFQYNWKGFIAIYAVLLLNLLFTLFCREFFATI